jgi:hypothetical protein
MREGHGAGPSHELKGKEQGLLECGRGRYEKQSDLSHERGQQRTTEDVLLRLRLCLRLCSKSNILANSLLAGRQCP